MKIEPNTIGFPALTKYPDADVMLWTGPILLGVMPKGTTNLPLHAMANNISTIGLHGVTVTNLDRTAPIPVDMGSFIQQYDGEDALLELLRKKTGPGVWSVYQIGIDAADVLNVKIGIVLPLGLIGQKFRLYCEDVEIIDMNIQSDPHFEYSHWYMPTGSILGVSGKVPLKSRSDYVRIRIEFDDIGTKLGKLAKAYRPLDCFTNAELLDVLPDISRIKRVAGATANKNAFLNGGRNASQRILDIVEEYGKNRNDKLAVLDWGVGCGRVAGHLQALDNLSITGIDIDRNNVDWCSKNLKGQYKLTGLMPPSPCETDQFDIIYSCSFLSHLTEEVAAAWLEEMNRVLKPDGIAILSFNGDTNFASYLGKRPEEIRKSLKTKMFVGDINHDLNGFIPSDDYYRASFAESQWWVNKFNEHLKLIAVEPAVVSGNQDMAVLTKKATLKKPSRKR